MTDNGMALLAALRIGQLACFNCAHRAKPTAFSHWIPCGRCDVEVTYFPEADSVYCRYKEVSLRHGGGNETRKNQEETKEKRRK